MLFDLKNLIELCVLQLPLLYFIALGFSPHSNTHEISVIDTPENMSLAAVSRTVVKKVLAVEQQEVSFSIIGQKVYKLTSLVGCRCLGQTKHWFYEP